MKLSKIFLFVSTAFLAISILAGCSAQSSKNQQEKTDIVIATDGVGPKPFTYTANGKLTGYDIDVAKAVFAKLPQYNITFQTIDFSSITSGIDSGRFQMGANDFSWTEARSTTYNFSSPFSKSNDAVLVKSGTYHTLADLAGKSTLVDPTTNFAAELEAWNKAHPTKQIKISYYQSSMPYSNIFSQIESGKYDFWIYDKISLLTLKKDYDLNNLKIENINDNAGDPQHDGYEYFLFSKDTEGQQLTKAVDKALAALQADGTLKKLSEKYFGEDFVPSPQMFK